MTSNMWISPEGEVNEVDEHWDFVAQRRFGVDSYDDLVTVRGNVDIAYDEIGEEIQTMLLEGWIRVVGQDGGMGGFSNSIGIQGTLDSMIRNQGALNEISYTTDADELIVEVVRPGDRPPKTFYIPAGSPVISTLMRQRITEGVSLDELRRRSDVRVRSHRRRSQ